MAHYRVEIPSVEEPRALAAIRQAVALPLDIYVEAPDDFGGFVRYYEAPEMVRVAVPVYLKLGVRNAPNIYPSGARVEPAAIALARERVHRAASPSTCCSRRSRSASSCSSC